MRRFALPIVVVAYAAAVIAFGAADAWHRPLSYDERLYYFPVIEIVAGALPRIPLDYPSAMPPAALVMQAALFRATGSIAAVRALSSIAAILTVVVVALYLRRRATVRATLLVAMIGCVPMLLLNAFTLKQHAITICALAAAMAAWERRRPVAVALLLALAVLTNQLAMMIVAGLALDVVRQRGIDRRLIALAVPAACLALLVLFVWHGVQPPSFHLAAAPELSHVRRIWPLQIAVALFVCGVWIVPSMEEWWRHWRVIVSALPITVAAFALTPLLRRPAGWDAHFYDRMVGPVIDAVERLARGSAPLAIGVAAAAAAAGCVLFAIESARPQQCLAIASVAVMLFVPFYFESYYSFLIVAVWILGSGAIAASRSRALLVFQMGAIAFGIAYTAAKMIA